MSFSSRPPSDASPRSPTATVRSVRSSSYGSVASPGSSSTGGARRTVTSIGGGAGGLPPPPPGVHHHNQQQQQHRSSYSQNIAQSMTIDEMRDLHQRALSDAEAKRTELRLVLASRYRELVGSSDEVIRMKERSHELHDLVHALPSLLEKLVNSKENKEKKIVVMEEETKKNDAADDVDTVAVTTTVVAQLRRQLSLLPRLIHRALDQNDVFTATTKLMELFTLIASQTRAYKLANALSSSSNNNNNSSALEEDDDEDLDPALEAQMRMVFLQMQTLPNKISRIARGNLLRAASYGNNKNKRKSTRSEKNMMEEFGAELSASALAPLHLLRVDKKADSDAATALLLETYFDCKAKLLLSLLDQLAVTEEGNNNNKDDNTKANAGTTTSTSTSSSTGNAEAILSKIVLILQYDIILFPYQIFCLRQFRHVQNSDTVIMSRLPVFAQEQVRQRCTKFLSQHLPLISNKVKTVLVSIAGTTASALGQIRQSLYDKTDGQECMERLAKGGWDDAIQTIVDVRTVTSQAGGGDGGILIASSGGSGTGSGAASSVGGVGNLSHQQQRQQRFSLWSALFSNTFSSLVHSLLTSAFQSVHTRVVSKLRASLANAPPLGGILPHEAYRNTLRIATELNEALLKVSDDAHELLVHAEEREESERRLRQSLYVQTCEIMGRLVCELRRMVHNNNSSSSNSSSRQGKVDTSSEATKELIVGRLCFLLKFRLTSLPTLLDGAASPAAMHSTTGMISFVDMQSAFELADDNEDGLITFEEAMEAVESAFSGSRFRGAEMVRETLLLPANSDQHNVQSSDTASNVTLTELTLLSARGLRHEAAGQGSALGAVQQALDDIVQHCFREWAIASLKDSTDSFEESHAEFLRTAFSVTEAEWQRLHPADVNAQGLSVSTTSNISIHCVSPYAICHVLDISSILNRTTCPSDSLAPVPSLEYASSLGVVSERKDSIPTLADNIRWALLRQSIISVSSILENGLSSLLVSSNLDLENSGISALAQYQLDVSFFQHCFFERNQYGFGAAETGTDSTTTATKTSISKCLSQPDEVLRKKCDRTAMQKLTMSFMEKYKQVFAVSDLSFSSLFGESSSATVSAAGELDLGMGIRSTSVSLFQAPLPSSRRFVLLPVQTDRSLNEIQLRGKYAKEKETSASRPEIVSPSVVSSGLGFLSSMLKKN